MKQSLQLRMGQSLSLTPALQQAIKMLQMSTLDLQMEIQTALDSNLMLELAESEASETETPPADESREPDPQEQLPEQPDLDFEWSDVYSGGDVASEQALYEYRQASIHRPPDLKEDLQDQLGLGDFTAAELQAIEHLIDALDARGYIADWPELQARISAACGLSCAQADSLLARLQACDPPGVGARTLAECLDLQLQRRDEAATPLARRIVADHLDRLIRRTPEQLAREMDVEPAAVIAALGLLRRLTPDPGAAYFAHEDHYIEPDVDVQKIEGRWVASLNPGAAPKLRLNREYQSLVKRADSSPDQQMLKSHLQEARYFLHSLRSRHETLVRVAQEIVDRQRSFLEYGPEAMRPLVLRDIADRLGMHESTISRATANKYMRTPRGLYELKYFFSSAVSTAEGGSCSATAIQAMIRRLIAAESPSKPLSDSKLTSLLKAEGVNVARRTVAKYREGMNIPPSHERRAKAS